ncbi:intradiol ring-cleavage dioxygenase [Thiofilum flexile]|uniref:intradiol ring-cleavage dioxygenase n=1 Tax=Thiofilum flexile TaxID=125627 RepID=UPI00035EBAFD|nr:intradiol ring-cleavage dioxygenase [Thiofilum flexile]
MSENLNRRSVLKLLATAPTAAGLVWLSPAMAENKAASVGLISSNVCQLTPEVTEGPYYLDKDLVRADIREDRTGIPLKMRIQVVGADCKPLEKARVDIWHCDAQGNYSGYSGQGSDTQVDTSKQTFLRGTQMTDSAGIATFQTIYPGWYMGRTVHIHFKVFLDQTQVLTGQAFFPDALSQYIFDNAPDYGGRKTTRDMININDGIAKEAGEGSYAAVREQTDGYDAALVVGIDPEARSVQRGGNPPPPPMGADGKPLPPPNGRPPLDANGKPMMPPGGGMPPRMKEWKPVDLIPTASSEDTTKSKS